MTQEAMSEVSGQQEQLMQIGAYLQEVRSQQGLSLDQVASKTLIQTRLLRAIESGDMNALPEAVYIRGFVKRYADYLGLNGTEVASTFPVNTESQPIPTGWNTSAAAQLRPLHLYAAYIALIVAAISGVSYLLSALSRPTISQQATPPVESAVEEAPDSSVEASAAPESPGAIPGVASAVVGDNDAAADVDGVADTPEESDAPVQVSLELVERSWLRVIVDGTEEFEGVLQEGTTQTWTAENTVTVRAGNAGGVLLAVNDQPAEAMGEAGSVSEQTFSPDGETSE